MSRIVVLGWIACLVVLGLAGCATPHGPRAVTLTPVEIEREINADLGRLLEAFQGLDVRRPEVGLLPMSQRLQLSWTVRLPTAPGEGTLLSWTGVTVEISGRPQLNAAGNAIELADALIDDIRLDGLPRLLGLGMARLTDRKGAALPNVPLVGVPEHLLKRDAVVYAASDPVVTYRGLRLTLTPR